MSKKESTECVVGIGMCFCEFVMYSVISTPFVDTILEVTKITVQVSYLDMGKFILL